MDATNLSEFVDLLTRCLKAGWQYVGTPPGELQWRTIVQRGRAMDLLETTRPCVGGRVIERLHFIRGQRPNCLLHFNGERARVGLWGAWATYHFKANDQFSTEQLQNPHHLSDFSLRSVPRISQYIPPTED